MSLSPISRYCDTHGYIMEHSDNCPYCQSRLHKYQRVTGYLRDVDNFNPGKAAEFRDRNQSGAFFSNKLTSAIVFGGLEPFEQWDELHDFIRSIRKEYNCSDDIVIYTGYNKDEISYQITILKEFENIIIKFGRYVPNEESHFDETLGVFLVSNNQYGEKIS